MVRPSSSPTFAGEGDHPRGGGGVVGPGVRNYPFTMLRMVPLPTKSWGGNR
jgi:hypothetical protein